MLQINPNHSDRLVQSVQRDYYQNAENYRLLKACGAQTTHTRTTVTIILSLIALTTAVFTISQFFI
ncbi:MAG: hypothetical protein GY805_37260 [Chloroflexi bacterium]|nr:hypothetical protein [Chloroflexota bacterium]